MSFLEKYKPKSLNDFVGNSQNIIKIKDWLSNFKENKEKSILLSGPPGIGKTTIATLIFKKFNYIPIEFNASELRTAKSLENKLDNILNNSNILSMFNDNRKIGIIMDEIDGCSVGDRGGLKKIIKYLKKKQKFKNPIILICNNESKLNILQIKKLSLYIKFLYPRDFEFKNFINKIILSENLNLNDEFKLKIYKNCQNDFRRILNILELINRNKEKLTNKNLNLLIHSCSNKNISYKIITILNKLFNSTENISIIEYIDLAGNETKILLSLIHANFINFLYLNRIGDNKQKLILTINLYKFLHSSLKINFTIYSKCNWFLRKYSNILGGFSSKILINKLKKTSYNKSNKIITNTNINKLSVRNINNKNKICLCKKLKIPFSHFNVISDIYLTKIYNNYFLFPQLNITFLDLEKLIKFSLNNKYWVKKFNKEFLKKIKQLIKQKKLVQSQ